MLFKKYKIRGQKEAWPRSRDLLFNSEIPSIFHGESYKLSKVVNVDNGNLRAEPPSWSRCRTHSERGWGNGVCPTPPSRNQTFAYLSVNFACNFVQECSAATGETVHISLKYGMLITPFAFLILLVRKTANINCKKTGVL